MILLRHLHIAAFKHLRNIDLWLPRNGSVLIEGHNESGKSTLFEAIYFALYGKALVGEDSGNPALDALLPHGEPHAGVKLTITVGASELTVSRTLTRNARGVKHDAELHIQRPGQPDETIAAVQAVNECILREVNGLDSAVLRNSCLMEQQALDRIETLSAANRELAIAKLLGIDAIQEIERDLKVTRKDEAELETANRRLEAAQHWQQAREASERAEQAAVALRATTAAAALANRDQLTEQLQATQRDLNATAGERAQLHERLQRVEMLGALQAQSETSERLLRTAEDDATRLALTQAQQGATASTSVQLAQAQAELAEAERAETTQREQATVARSRTRIGAALVGSASGAFVLLAAAGLAMHLLFALALVALIATVILQLRLSRLMRSAQDDRARLATLTHEATERRATVTAMQRLRSGSGATSGISEAEVIQRATTSHETAAQAITGTIAALRAAGIPISQAPRTPATVADLRQMHEAAQQPLQAEWARLDVATAQRQRGTLDAREQQLRDTYDTLLAQREGERQRLTALLGEQGIAADGEETRAALVAHWQALAMANATDDTAMLAATVERERAVAEQLRQQVEALCQQQGFDVAALDVATCQASYDTLAETLRQRRVAAELADEVFKRIVQRVLPETEMHMRALLPELTDGRYRDVSLLDDGSADLRIRIWDEQAGRWVGKHLFSGGTRDQCSLALRLAFALATLPRELGAMPGFIFLDEPLSSFDDRRSQALVDVLTRGPIARQFPQVFLISHSQSFDPSAFTCALRMSGGRIAASTLPDEATATAQWQEEHAPVMDAASKP